MKKLMVVALALGVALSMTGCAPPGASAVTDIAFLADGHPAKTGMFVEIDMTFSPGANVKGGTTYPHEWITKDGQFSHHQLAGKGTVSSYLFKVHPTEPGQTVTCSIVFNGNVAKPVDIHMVEYPKVAICGGPPV